MHTEDRTAGKSGWSCSWGADGMSAACGPADGRPSQRQKVVDAQDAVEQGSQERDSNDGWGA
ncbi:MAG: hypothetical protein CMH83_19305 [Nocardioides sp.]|nr:hypothetical protein [Nocardioides sp.]